MLKPLCQRFTGTRKKWTGKAGKLCIDKLWRWMQANVAWMQQQKKDTKERQQKNKQKSNPFRWSHFRTIFGERREIVLTPRPYRLSPAHSAFDYRSDWIVCKWLGEEKWTVKRCTPRLLCTGVRRNENKTHTHAHIRLNPAVLSPPSTPKRQDVRYPDAELMCFHSLSFILVFFCRLFPLLPSLLIVCIGVHSVDWLTVGKHLVNSVFISQPPPSFAAPGPG